MGLLSYAYKAWKAGKKTAPTISSTKINVGNLKKNQDTMGKLIKTTDAYVTKAGSVDPGLKKALRDAGSKSLQKTEKILRKNKKDGGRMGYKSGSKDGVGRDHGGTTLKLKDKKFFMLGDSKKDQKKYYDMSRAGARDMNKTGQGKKFRDATTVDKETGQIKIKRDEKRAMGGRIGRKMGGGSDMSNTNVKKKYKGFSKLPETVQIKINKKLAKKV